MCLSLICSLLVRFAVWFGYILFVQLLDFLLLARVPYGFVNGETASVDAVTRNWWCVLRLFFSFLIALLAYIYDAHVSFRWFSVLVLPLQVAVESVSEVANVSAWHCLEQGICVPDAFLHRLYYWMVWRDLVGVTLKLLCMVFAYWLFFIHGYAKNEIYNPRREHRDMSIKLDGMKLQAKKIIRKKLDSSTS